MIVPFSADGCACKALHGTGLQPHATMVKKNTMTQRNKKNKNETNQKYALEREKVRKKKRCPFYKDVGGQEWFRYVKIYT